MPKRADYVVLADGFVRRVQTAWEEPSVSLVRWRLTRVRHADGSVHRHVMGNGNGEGRISTRLHTIDLDAMSVTTRTGRIYRLLGSTGDDYDAAYLYARWLGTCGRTEIGDLSRALLRLRRIRLNLK